MHHCVGLFLFGEILGTCMLVLCTIRQFRGGMTKLNRTTHGCREPCVVQFSFVLAVCYGANYRDVRIGWGIRRDTGACVDALLPA